VLRLFSVLLAFIRYRGFTLELEGEKLMAQHGMGTHVRTSARLPRLQRWELEQSWLHRWLGRCRLSVTAVGNHHHEGNDKISADSNFTELAPIATPQQARALLQLCLPRLNWEQLPWQSLQGAAKRRLLGQARWVLPVMACLVWMDYHNQWPWPWPMLVLALGLGMLALVAHALAWQRFAAFAECDEVLVFRSGVFRQRWVIISTPRLQALRLVSTPLDRRLGMCTLQADTQGGSRRSRALHIPCLSQAQAGGLRQRIWQRMQAG
jgi:putative membrane protein